MNTVVQISALIEFLIAKVSAKEMTKSEAGFTLAKACLGWPYVYSAWGAECTPSERKKRFNMKPDHTTIKTACQVLNGSKGSCTGCKWYPDGKRVRCFDCRGFVYWILMVLFGFKLSGSTVASQWNTAANWCVKGKVADGIPQNVLVNLFIYNTSEKKWKHTGFYYNGETIEASSNVQFFSPMKKNRWTHWAIAACLIDEYEFAPIEVPDKPKEDTPVADETKMIKLQKGSKGDAVQYLQNLLLMLGYDLGKWGADGDFGSKTQAAVKAFQKSKGLTADGIVGPKTWEALIGNQEDQEKTVTVHIPKLSKAEATILLEEFPGSYTTED